jgi:hypothetical protein
LTRPYYHRFVSLTGQETGPLSFSYSSSASSFTSAIYKRRRRWCISFMCMCMCYIKVANPRDSHVPNYSNDPPVPPQQHEEEEQSRVQRHAASLLMSEYGQAREMSIMVSALTRVVSGEGAPPVRMTSAPAVVTSQFAIKRGRENEAVVPEEVLRYYRGFARHWWTGSRHPGEASTSSVPRGELLRLILFLLLFLYFLAFIVSSFLYVCTT